MFGTISFNDLFKEAKRIGNGRICRIGYRSELPVQAPFKAKGLKVTKFTTKSVRFGVKYRAIKTLLGLIKSTNDKKSNIVVMLPNKIFERTDLDRTYLQIAKLNKNTHEKNVYIVHNEKTGLIKVFNNDEEWDNSYYRNCILKSYYEKETPEIQTINVLNIFKFGNIEA